MRLSAALVLLLALAAPALALPPPGRVEALARGVNVTHWFRFPAGQDEAHFTSYLRDSDLRNLREAGFTLVRLPVDPAVLAEPDGRLRRQRLAQLETAIGRIIGAGLAVMVHPHPPTSAPFDQPPMQRQVRAMWQGLAPALAKFPPEKLFPEIMSEPIFKDREADWHAMQVEFAAIIRAAMPRHTIIATGANWSSIDGLLRLPPLPDPNLVYTFHFYWPPAFTHQQATWLGPVFRALKGLPWPSSNSASCLAAAAGAATDQARAVGQWYCRQTFDAARLAREVARARDWANRHGAAIHVGEFGAGCFNPDRAARLAWIRDARLAFDASRVGWALWGLDNCQGFGNDHRRREFVLAPDMLEALGMR
jgi:endoglucanase